jgi:hypothetical protein
MSHIAKHSRLIRRRLRHLSTVASVAEDTTRQPYRVLFFGSSDFGAPALTLLLDAL